MKQIKTIINNVDCWLLNHLILRDFLVGMFRAIKFVLSVAGVLLCICLPIVLAAKSNNYYWAFLYVLEFIILGGILEVLENDY